MTPVESLYYAVGEIAYAIAKSDGKIQKEEKDKLHSILLGQFSKHPADLDVAEIIFQLLQKDDVTPERAYESAVHELKLNSHYVSDGMKKAFIGVMRAVSEAFPPVSKEEEKLTTDFIHVLEGIQGDPVFNKYTA